MAKVLFVNPVIREEDDPRHVPYGIALLAAIIMRAGHLVQVFDANAWRASDAVLSQVLAADRWDVVALGGITTAYRSIKQIVCSTGMARNTVRRYLARVTAAGLRRDQVLARPHASQLLSRNVRRTASASP